MRHDSVHIRLSFLSDPNFIRLVSLLKEPMPITLGRVIALALATAYDQRVRYSFAEIDGIAAWTSGAANMPLAYHLSNLGWARRTGSLEVALTLPSDVQPVNPHRLSGIARAAKASRDGSGRYLPSATPRENRIRTSVDADGNVVAEAFVAGGKAVRS